MKKIFLLLVAISLFASSTEKIVNDILNNFNDKLKILSSNVKCDKKICIIDNPKVIHKENKIEFYEAEKIIIKLINENTIEADVINLKFSKQLDYILGFAIEKLADNVYYNGLDFIWNS